MLKGENKRKLNICKKGILTNSPTEKLNKERAKQAAAIGEPPPISTDSLHFKIQNEVLDKEKEISQNCPQKSVYSKHNHRPSPVINHFSSIDNPFWQQKLYTFYTAPHQPTPNSQSSILIQHTSISCTLTFKISIASKQPQPSKF